MKTSTPTQVKPWVNQRARGNAGLALAMEIRYREARGLDCTALYAELLRRSIAM